MQYCRNCDEFIKEPDVCVFTEYHDEVDTRREEEIYDEGCPYCGNSELVETGECQICGEGTQDTKHEFCISCHEELEACLSQFMERLKIDADQLQSLIIEHMGW